MTATAAGITTAAVAVACATRVAMGVMIMMMPGEALFQQPPYRVQGLG